MAPANDKGFVQGQQAKLPLSGIPAPCLLPMNTLRKTWGVRAVRKSTDSERCKPAPNGEGEPIQYEA